MDDYIQNHGSDRFKREVMGKVVNIAAWEKQFQIPEPLKTASLHQLILSGAKSLRLPRSPTLER
jgi:hypothetical protein